MDRLECKTTVRDLRNALTSLPTGVNEIYNDAMTRIQNQVREHRDLAILALSWIWSALWPLNWNELQHALAVRPGDTDLDEEGLEDQALLISVCAGLITLDAPSGTIRLAHFTVEEYFEENKQNLFPIADCKIAETCLTYLSFNVFKTGPCQSPGEMENRLQQHYLLEYAAATWGYHTRIADEVIDQNLAVQFLTNDRLVSSCLQVDWGHPFSQPTFLHRQPQIRKVGQSSGLHLAAQFGLVHIFKKLLESNNLVDAKDNWGYTPLAIAVIQGHVEMVEFLVNHDDVSAEFTTIDGRTPLSLAVSHGHTEIVKCLVAQSDEVVDFRDNVGWTPLSHAALSGQVEIVKLLLARDDVIADSRDLSSRTPLLYAASGGHTEIVKLLVARDDVLAESRDIHGRTPLSYAAWEEHAEIVKLLVARGDVVADSQDNDGRTPLSHAAEIGNEAMVKLLLDRVDVAADSRSNDGRTPLSYAAEMGNVALVKLLLDRVDVEGDSRDNDGRTPVSHASHRGSQGVGLLVL